MTKLDENIQKIVKWEPHGGGQQDVLECENREVIVCAGRGWGKSMLMAYIVFRELADALADERPFKCFIIAPTYPLTDKVFEHFLSSFLLKYDRSLAKYVSGGRNRPYEFKFSNEVWIQCKSTTEPMSMLGERVDLAIVDEAALIPAKVYQQYIRPITASATKKGKVYYISTPRGEGWYKKVFALLSDKNAAFKFKSTQGVEVTEERLEEEKKVLPELLFQQEYLAEFVSDAGSVFRNVDQIVVPSNQILQDSVAGHFYIIGWDVAEEQDYSVMTVIDTTTKHIVHLDRFKGRDYPLQKKQIIAKAQRYNNARVIMDTTGVGKSIYEDLRVAGIYVDDYTFSGKSKEELIGNLIVNCEERYIRIPDIQVLVDELKHFEYKFLNEKTGEKLRNIKYGAPQGYHDDCVDSLALAVWGLSPGVPKQPNKLKEEIKKRSRNNKPQSFI